MPAKGAGLGGANAAFRWVNLAAEILDDPTQRQLYVCADCDLAQYQSARQAAANATTYAAERPAFLTGWRVNELACLSQCKEGLQKKISFASTQVLILSKALFPLPSSPHA